MLTACLLGFLLGLRHASDPDHVIAVATIVTRHRRALLASWIGVAWGVGHSATIVGVGAAIVALHLAVPTQIAVGMEATVGVVLVTLGLSNLRTAGHRPHAHEAWTQPRDSREGIGRALVRAFAVGLVHGLAGSAAVSLLALAAMPTPAAAVVYLAVFGFGTIGGMVAISLGIGAPLAWATGVRGARRWILAGSGALSLGFGAWIVWEAVRGLRGALA